MTYVFGCPECTINNTFEWIENYAEYQYSWQDRDVGYLLINKKGDCTEAALTAKWILYKYNIRTKFTYGYAVCGYGENRKNVKYIWLSFIG